MLRSLILSGEDRRRSFIHPRCTRTVEPSRTTAPPSWPKESTTRGQTQTPPTTHLVTAPTRRARQWRKVCANQQSWPRPWPYIWPDVAAGDPSAVQFRFELKERGIGGKAPEKVRHAVTSGQDVLRSLILSGEDRRRFFIHPRCTRTVEAFKNYRATELAEGIYDPRPDPDPSNHTYSHGTDQARYLCWYLRMMFGLAGYEG